MLSAVKESMKNWLKSHERLYWYIVVGIAVLAFGIITAVGCAKLERAHAAQTYCAPEEAYEIIMQSFVSKFGEQKINTHTYYALTVTTTGWYNMQISTTPFYVVNTAGYNQLWYDGPVYHGSLSPTGVRDVELTGTTASQNRIRLDTPSTVLMCNHDLYLGTYLYREKDVTVEYSPEAPHVMFESFGHDNKIAQGDTKAKLFDDIYEDYTSVSKWSYGGKIVNMTSGDVSYKLLLDITVELPNDSLIIQMAEAAGVDITWERNALNYTPEFVKAWYQYNGSDFSRYKFEVELPITINERGEFGYEFSFPVTEYLLMGDDNFKQRFQVYNSEDNTYWKAILLSYLHIDTVSTVLETTRADSVVYGKVHSVRLKRGYEHWTSAITAVDKDFVSSDLLDSMVNSDLQIAEREHLNELENRLDEMQNQIDSMNNFETAFGGNLEGSDLWTGFGSLSKGLSSLGPSIRSLSSLTGSVFAFIPAPIANIISFSLLAICIIAIIKAIRG